MWFHIFLIFTPNLGEMIQFDLRILFKWVGEKPPTRRHVTRNFPEGPNGWFVFVGSFCLSSVGSGWVKLATADLCR